MIQALTIPANTSATVRGIRGFVPVANPGLAATYQRDTGLVLPIPACKLTSGGGDSDAWDTVTFSADPTTALQLYVAIAAADVDNLPDPPTGIIAAEPLYLFTAGPTAGTAIDTGVLDTAGQSELMILLSNIGATAATGYPSFSVVMADATQLVLAAGVAGTSANTTWVIRWGNTASGAYVSGASLAAGGLTLNGGSALSMGVPKKIRVQVPAAATSKPRLDIFGLTR